MPICLLVFAAVAPPALIPLPQSVTWEGNAFRLGPEIAVVGDEVASLRAPLESALGVRMRGNSLRRIEFKQSRNLPREGYQLRVGPDLISVTAATYGGFFNAIQTLRQLNVNGQIAGCQIQDSPRFGWRGLLLDESRHFFGEKTIQRFLDKMAVYKLNTFHWHLTDDGGWRMQSRRYPELTRTGGFRKEQGVTWDYGNLWFPGPGSGQKLYGGFYTQAQLRAMVQYAADRNITVVPEIEMPGHSTAVTSAMPELQCSPPPGVKEAYLKQARSQSPAMLCPGKDATLEFCRNILNETIDIFPSRFIHIGADEVDKTLWKQCADCQARIKSQGLKNVDELQSWFVRQMERHLASKGRRLIGWDEILEGGLAPGATVMSWRGVQGGIEAAKSGHDVVMSPTSHCYLDYSYATTPTEKVYSYEPIPNELAGSQRERVLGGQGNVWTEWIATPTQIDVMTYPRAVALAETLWTAPERKNWGDFSRRLDSHYALMDKLGFEFRIETPKLVPDVLNQEVASSWTVANPPIPGTRTYVNGRELRKPTIAAGRAPIRVQYGFPSGRRSEVTVGSVVRLRPSKATGMAGLRMKRIDWTNRQCPPLTAFRSAPQSVVQLPSLAEAPFDKPSALLFEGLVTVPRDGRYTLILGSDDGSILYLDGKPVLPHDGEHGYLEKAITIDLQKGAYPMQIVYFDAGGAKRLVFDWIEPGRPRATVTGFSIPPTN